MLIAGPVFAQTAPEQVQGTPQQAAPAATSPDSAQAEPGVTEQKAESAQTAPAGTTGTAAPASGAAQVAQVVHNDWGTFDKNKDGALDQAEFGTWLVALRTAADPNFKGGTAEANSWVGQAFAVADTDKNKGVSEAELTGFLSKAG
jgi:hypothetical protein